VKGPENAPLSATGFDRESEIDRNAYVPAYLQLADALQAKIADGSFRPGDKLPSEARLRQQHQLSQMTVRRAVNILLQRGLVRTAQGRGTFVKSPDISEAVFQLRELKEYIVQGDRARVKLMEARVLPADERVARKLCIELGEWAIYIRRLLMDRDTPISYHREYLVYDPKQPIVEGELEVTSLEGLIRGNGKATLQSGAVTIECVTLRDDEAQLLQMAPGSAAFLLEHVFRDSRDRPASWGWFLWRGDRIKFSATLGARRIVKHRESGDEHE
jgi:GntR family transcriptional regulator